MESFTLSNRPAPITKPREKQPEEKLRQTVLFSGLHCLPGQLDLFATDGPAESRKNNVAVGLRRECGPS